MRQFYTILVLFLYCSSSFGQTGMSQFSDASGNYQASSSGFCFSCSISDTSQVADMDLSNYSTIMMSAGAIATRGIRAKLNALVPGNTMAGFFIDISNTISGLPSVKVSTYKNGVFQETVVNNGDLISLLGGS